MQRTIAALVAAAAINQSGHVVYHGAATQVMSPTVVATWYARGENDSTNRLLLVILWRGSTAWWRQPGGIRIDGDNYSIVYGFVRLTVRYDSKEERVSVNGRDVALGGDNVLYVDNVDAGGGPTFVRTSRIDFHMPGTVGQIGSMLGHSDEILKYMQCDARAGNPKLDAELASMCLTNLGRR